MVRPHIHIEPSAFCWRPYWSSRFESLWSLLRKFAYLNAITSREIRILFGSDSTPQSLDQWKWCLRSDLRRLGGLDAAILSIIFGSGYSNLAEATVLPYVHESEASILTSEFLRFCPTCIRQGFHSTLHQLLFLATCPAHGDRLENRCMDCLTETIPYTLPSVSSKDISKCTHVLNGLKQHLKLSSIEKLRKEAADRERALLSDAEWLMKRVELNTPEQPIAQWVPQGAGRRYFTRYFKRLPAYWADVFMYNSRKGSFNVSKVRGTHIQVWSRECFRPSVPNSRHDLKASSLVTASEARDLELYRIYKAIRRHLTRNYLLRHRRCIVKVGRHIWWERLSLTWQGSICPAANAMLLWRMFYEGVNEPNKLFRPLGPHRSWFNDPQPRVYWDRPSVALPERVVRRIFTLECVGIFYECLLLAEALYRRNAYSFQVEYVKGRRRPHWLIEGGGGSEVTIHWWLSRPLPSLFGHTSSLFKSCRAKQCPGDRPILAPSLAPESTIINSLIIS
jgi:hypothetical protein